MQKPHKTAIVCTSGFTLIEILLVVAAIAILAGIVIIAINPNKQLGDTRNAQRRSDVVTILNAVYQYSLDHNGTIPPSITVVQTEICKAEAGSCSGLINLGVLYENEKYIVSMPFDPSGGSTNGTGYEIKKTNNNRVTVVSSDAEQGAIISVSR